MIDIDALPEMNPDVRRIFEENRAKLEKIGWTSGRKPPDSQLALPYSDDRLGPVQDSEEEGETDFST